MTRQIFFLILLSGIIWLLLHEIYGEKYISEFIKKVVE